MDDDDCYQICEFCFNHTGVFCSCAGSKKSMELETKREFLNSTFAEFNTLSITEYGEKKYFLHETGVKAWK